MVIPEFDMTIREELELKEEKLSPFAMRSAMSRGRALQEDPCPIRTEYMRDRDRIIHSKAFRRLMHKTQVFLSPEGDHYRTRLTHTLEVSQISRTIARALDLNEDLTEAIALRHDLGHTPFGHNGETVLNEIHPGGFRHNEQSLRVVDLLERSGERKGMNLTYEVRDGILNHSGPVEPGTLEGKIVRISDRIAYINHDIDDALRSGVISFDDLPEGPIAFFGSRHSERINSMVLNVIETSRGLGTVRMDDLSWQNLLELRDYMFRNVYRSKLVKKEEDLARVDAVIKGLYNFYRDDPEKLPAEYLEIAKAEGPDAAARDFVASMTDRYAMNKYESVIGKSLI